MPSGFRLQALADEGLRVQDLRGTSVVALRPKIGDREACPAHVASKPSSRVGNL